MDREAIERQIHAHQRAAAKATDPAKRQQHLLAVEHYQRELGVPTLELIVPPSYAVICAELRVLGLDNALAMFWDAHQHQAEGDAGRHLHWKAFNNMRRLAAVALDRHKRSSIWLPSPVGFGCPMEFFQVKLPPPKGERTWFPVQQEVLT